MTNPCHSGYNDMVPPQGSLTWECTQGWQGVKKAISSNAVMLFYIRWSLSTLNSCIICIYCVGCHVLLDYSCGWNSYHTDFMNNFYTPVWLVTVVIKNYPMWDFYCTNYMNDVPLLYGLSYVFIRLLLWLEHLPLWLH